MGSGGGGWDCEPPPSEHQPQAEKQLRELAGARSLPSSHPSCLMGGSLLEGVGCTQRWGRARACVVVRGLAASLWRGEVQGQGGLTPSLPLG